MADDWEDWENEEFVPKLPAVAKPAVEFETKGKAVLASIGEPDMAKFQDEDKEEEPPAPSASAASTKPQGKKDKKEVKKQAIDDIPLDDPVAEKARQQRLIEESDYKATKDLFGDDEKSLDGWLPKSVKDFEDYAKCLVDRYVISHRENKNFKAFLKAVIKLSCEPLTVQETKDIETAIAGLRTDKVKAEVAAASAKKAGPKKFLNVGKGGASAGLDDYIEGAAPVDDDYDFM